MNRTTTPEALRALADSPFAKENADLVILGTADTSGVPIEERLAAIRDAHTDYRADYRLVPAGALRAAAQAIEDANEAYRETLGHLAHFLRVTPSEDWPMDLRRAHDLLDQIGWEQA